MNARPRVLVTRLYPSDLMAALRPLADVIMPADEHQSFGRDDALRQGASLAGIINQGELRIDAELIAALPQLKIVANTAIGTNNFSVEAMRVRAIWGTNTPEAFVDATADCTLGLIIAVARRIGEGERFVRAGRWNSFAPGTWDGMLLRGRTLGLVGYGRIGQAVALRAEAFGLKVLHHTRTASQHSGWRPLDELLRVSDFVSLHVPLNDDSRGLIDAARLALLQPGAYLINMARGPVVDEPALLAALRSGRIAGAALDVFADEPHVPEAFRAMENVVLTPHIGGGSREGRRLGQALCIENVRRVLMSAAPRPECVVVSAGAP